MFYLSLAFGGAWVCHLVYLLIIDRQVREMTRRSQAHGESPGSQETQ